jgi:hypothetical protein
MRDMFFLIQSLGDFILKKAKVRQLSFTLNFTKYYPELYMTRFEPT